MVSDASVQKCPGTINRILLAFSGSPWRGEERRLDHSLGDLGASSFGFGFFHRTS